MSSKQHSEKDSHEQPKTHQPAPIKKPEAQPVASINIPQPGGLTPESLSPQNIIMLQRTIGNRAVCRLLNQSSNSTIQRKENGHEHAEDDPAAKIEHGSAKTDVKDDASARFGGDKKMEKIASGSETLKRTAKGLAVIKLQQALIDMGYPLAKVDGDFGPKTQAVVKMFQHDEKIPETGVFDQVAIQKMQARFESRKPYLDKSTFDPADPNKGTRTLTAADKAHVKGAMVPARGGGGRASTFQENVGGKHYGPEIKSALTTMIASFHKELFEEKEPKRSDPAKNFHPWGVLEGAAAAATEVTDAVYGSYAKGPPMTQVGGNFVDQWEDELTRNAALNPDEQKKKARGKVWYLINSNATTINEAHSAVPSDTKEKAILNPIVESFVDNPAKVKTMLEIDVGWEGAQLEGIVYLQRYKKDSEDANRLQLWDLFHTCIHEYIHSLANPKYQAYAEEFRLKGDETRYNTLIEGMDDFFTENVRQTVKINDPLRQKVEGPHYDKNAAAPVVTPPTYPSKAQAEQVVSIVGIGNAQAAYFKGEVELIGGK